MYPGVGTFVLIRPTQTFYERIKHVPGVEVWAYGSRVNGESHDGSDLDLVLRGPALEPLDGGFFDLLEAIEKSNIPILV